MRVELEDEMGKTPLNGEAAVFNGVFSMER